jgi:hypothetical protein
MLAPHFAFFEAAAATSSDPTNPDQLSHLSSGTFTSNISFGKPTSIFACIGIAVQRLFANFLSCCAKREDAAIVIIFRKLMGVQQLCGCHPLLEIHYQTECCHLVVIAPCPWGTSCPLRLQIVAFQHLRAMLLIVLQQFLHHCQAAPPSSSRATFLETLLELSMLCRISD